MTPSISGTGMIQIYNVKPASENQLLPTSAVCSNGITKNTAAYLQNHNIRLWKRKRERYIRLCLKGKKLAALEGRYS